MPKEGAPFCGGAGDDIAGAFSGRTFLWDMKAVCTALELKEIGPVGAEREE